MTMRRTINHRAKGEKRKAFGVLGRSLFFSLLMAATLAQAQAPDRSRPPQVGPPPELKLPPIQRLQLSNGLPVVLFEKHEVPLVQVNVLIKAGSAMDPADKAGLASMTLAMLDEGAGRRDALQLADAIDFLGARISPSSGYHTSRVALHTPLSKLDSALVLLADVVLRPTFPATELDRQRKQRLTTLIQWRDEPRSIASVLFNRTLYGTKHPYGIPTIGTERSLKSLRPEDLKEFHVTYFRPNNAALIVVGDVTAETLLPRLEAQFGSWERGRLPTATWPGIRQVGKRQIYLVDKPGAAQSEIRIGRVGLPRLTRDYYAVVVMNTILGGSFTSRLNQNLREEHGYSYGAGSFFDFRTLPGPFVAASAVQTDVTDKAVAEFMKELNGILEPVPEEELTRARNYVALRFPQSFQTVAQIAGRLEELVTYDLPDSYFNEYVDRILEVTAEDVQRVARKTIDPERIAIVIVGDRQKIEKGIRALNLGPIKVMTVEDVLGKMPKVEGTS